MIRLPNMTSLKLTSYELTSCDMYVGFAIIMVIMLYFVLLDAIYLKLSRSVIQSARCCNTCTLMYQVKCVYLLLFPFMVFIYLPYSEIRC